MKKWKKSGRKRNNKNKLYSVKIGYSVEEHNRINEYRVEHSYSWEKLANVAIKNSLKENK